MCAMLQSVDTKCEVEGAALRQALSAKEKTGLIVHSFLFETAK